MRITFLATLALSIGTALAAQTKTFRFEVEDCTTPGDAWVKNKWVKDKWNLWSTDANKKNWSKEVVLQSPKVEEDRTPGEGGAPVLHTTINGIPKGTYDVYIKGTRSIGISFDGKTWKPSSGECILEKAKIENGKFELWVDDCYKNRNGNVGPCYYDFIEFRQVTPPKQAKVWPKVNGWAKERAPEKLDRGTVALKTPAGVYLSWRLLKSDPADLAFDVYRFAADGTAQKLNQQPIKQTTDFQDKSAPQNCEDVTYAVCPEGQKPTKTEAVTVADKGGNGLPYVSIPLRDKKLRFGRCATADLNGDGKLDYIIKTPNASIDPWYKYWKKSPGTYKIEAYLHDGTHLWTRDLGWSIEQGIWYSPYVVADLTGDGKAEVAVKTGEGDPRDAEGKVKSGPEYLSIWDGMTGKDITKVPWPPRDGYNMSRAYNYASRNQIAVAYLDGRTPCVISLRGTYNRMEAKAYMLENGKLTHLWTYNNDGLGRKYWGQGEHFTHAIDVDGDGRDEVMLGSTMLDDNGVPLWSTGLGHNDAAYVGDHDITRPGLEIFYIIETRAKKNGMCMVDAATGEILWGYDKPTTHVHSAGMCADIDPVHPGTEGFAMNKDNDGILTGPWLWSAKGDLLAFESPKLPKSHDIHTAYWDADLQKECLQRAPTDYEGGAVDMRFAGRRYVTADILGDWREEIITSVPGEIRIYSTTIPAMDRRVCLLQDPIYRADVRMGSMGYTKDPTLSYNPVAVSPNVNLTAMKDDKGNQVCRVVISAPLKEELVGTLTIDTANVSPEQRKHDIKLAPGKLQVINLPIVPAAGEDTDYVRAQLATANGVLRASVPIRVKKTPTRKYATKLPRMEAEAFSKQDGGKVKIRTDKPYVSGKCFSHWDKGGHWLEWTFDVKDEGTYRYGLRYAACSDATRRIIIDGKPVGDIQIAGTGGFGDSEHDWAIFQLDAKALPALPRLEPGRHTFRMENVGDTSLNLDLVSYQKIR